MATSAVEIRSISTSDRILGAAFEAVQHFGLSRTTVEDVAQRAGLSRQTVYRYFPSKDHLVGALVLREEEKFIDGVRTSFAAEPDLERALAEATLFVLRYAHEHPLLDRLLATDQETLLPYLTTRGLPVIVRAREAMVELARERVQIDEEWVRERLDVTTRAMLSYILTPSERPPAAVARTLARMLIAAIEDRPVPREGASR